LYPRISSRSVIVVATVWQVGERRVTRKSSPSDKQRSAREIRGMTVHDRIQEAVEALIEVDALVDGRPEEERRVYRALVSAMIGLAEAQDECHRQAMASLERIERLSPPVPLTRVLHPLSLGME
jgi:coenzyme F420-reducing hydrogenase gamma subunit